MIRKPIELSIKGVELKQIVRIDQTRWAVPDSEGNIVYRYGSGIGAGSAKLKEAILGNGKPLRELVVAYVDDENAHALKNREIKHLARSAVNAFDRSMGWSIPTTRETVAISYDGKNLPFIEDVLTTHITRLLEGEAHRDWKKMNGLFVASDRVLGVNYGVDKKVFGRIPVEYIRFALCNYAPFESRKTLGTPEAPKILSRVAAGSTIGVKALII